MRALLIIICNFFRKKKISNDRLSLYSYDKRYLKRKQNISLNVNVDQFIQYMVEAATWVEFVSSKNGNTVVRSEEIRPEYNLLENPYSKDYWNSITKLSEYYDFQKRIVTDVVDKRSQILKEKGITLLKIDEVLKKGGLFYTFINQTVTDGACETVSNGFFDIYDSPPWDNWILLYEDKNSEILVSWVPLSEVENVEKAIEVNIIDCIHWAIDCQNDLTVQLTAKGLVREWE